MPAQTQLIDPDGNDLVTEVLTQLDRLEFLANKSKAKDREQQTLRALKKLRDYLITCGLDDFKLSPAVPAQETAPVVCSCGAQADHDAKYAGAAIQRGHL